tara:strand:+ start:871 stop:1344 length:474 start_codon:yes stop_codon:yes gene_type:complete
VAGILFFSSVIGASPNTLPIEVLSDAAEVDADAGIATHWGNVTMKQGQRRIDSEKLTVFRNHHGDVDTLTASGYPARYEGSVDNYEEIFGHASMIHFFPEKNQVLLEGQAELNLGKDHFNGPHLLYDIEEKTVSTKTLDSQVESNKKNRTMIVIQPR